MKEYIDVQYSKYKYYYFDGSYNSGLDIKNYFKGCARDINVYQYNIKIINVDGYHMPLEHFKEFYENEDVSINIKDYKREYTVDINNFDRNNFINAYAGDYIIMSDNGFPFFTIEKNLDNYEIISEHECIKRTEKNYLYEKFNGLSNAETIMNEIKNYINYVSINYNDVNERSVIKNKYTNFMNINQPYMIIENKYGNKFYLYPGKYVVIDLDEEKLFVF